MRSKRYNVATDWAKVLELFQFSLFHNSLSKPETIADFGYAQVKSGWLPLLKMK
jgi:hypothetical protein